MTRHKWIDGMEPETCIKCGMTRHGRGSPSDKNYRRDGAGVPRMLGGAIPSCDERLVPKPNPRLHRSGKYKGMPR